MIGHSHSSKCTSCPGEGIERHDHQIEVKKDPMDYQELASSEGFDPIRPLANKLQAFSLGLAFWSAENNPANLIDIKLEILGQKWARENLSYQEIIKSVRETRSNILNTYLRRFFHLRAAETGFNDASNQIDEEEMGARISKNSFFGPFKYEDTENGPDDRKETRRVILQGHFSDSDRSFIVPEGLYISWNQNSLELGI